MPETFDLDTSFIPDEVKFDLEDCYGKQLDDICDDDIRDYCEEENLTIKGINN